MEEINLVQLLNMFLRKWWLIVIFAIVGGTAAYMYTDICVNETYYTDGSFYVSVETQQVDTDEIVQSGKLAANARLATTYTQLLKSRTFLEEVSQQLYEETGLVYSGGAIKGMLSVSAANETEIISLGMTGTNPEHIYQVLCCVMANAPAKIINTVGGGSVTVVDVPYIPTAPTGPNKTRNSIMGILAGVVLSLLIIFFMDLFDTHIKSSEELRTKYELPVLGEIPQLNQQM